MALFGLPSMRHGNGLSGGSFLFRLSSYSSSWLCWLAVRMMKTTRGMGRKNHRAKISLITIDTYDKEKHQNTNFYNEERPHMSLDGLTPREAAKKMGEINKKWVSYRGKAIKAKVV